MGTPMDDVRYQTASYARNRAGDWILNNVCLDVRCVVYRVRNGVADLVEIVQDHVYDQIGTLVEVANMFCEWFV